MKLTCDQATQICDKSQYGEASFKELFLLKYHIFFCKKCKEYSKQNGFITKCMHTKELNENLNKLTDLEKGEIDNNLKSNL